MKIAVIERVVAYQEVLMMLGMISHSTMQSSMH